MVVEVLMDVEVQVEVQELLLLQETEVKVEMV
jgi:hypothetical protein